MNRFQLSATLKTRRGKEDMCVKCDITLFSVSETLASLNLYCSLETNSFVLRVTVESLTLLAMEDLL